MKKKIIESKQFQVDGDFKSTHAAESWLTKKGYHCGSMSYPLPTAIMKGDYYDYDLPHKWKNFSKAQINSVHGKMTGNFRNGPVFIELYE